MIKNVDKATATDPKDINNKLSQIDKVARLLDATVTADGNVHGSVPVIAAYILAFQYMEEEKWVESLKAVDRARIEEGSAEQKLVLALTNKDLTRRPDNFFYLCVESLHTEHQSIPLNTLKVTRSKRTKKL